MNVTVVEGDLLDQDVDVIVGSSAVFKHPDGIAAGVQDLRRAIDEAAAKHLP